MADFRCIVVCEGSSDFPFLEGVIKKIGELNSKKFEAILIAPDTDATGKYQQFGYEGVKRWCKYNLNQFVSLGRNKIGSLMAWHSADLVLVHLDADIADRIELNSTYFSGGIKKRKEWCVEALDSWLGILKDSIEVKYVIPAMQIETWLLSTFDKASNPELFLTEITDYEAITDVEQQLLALGYLEDKDKPGRLYKEKHLFETNPQYVLRLLNHIELATSRCSELSSFRRSLNAY